VNFFFFGKEILKSDLIDIWATVFSYSFTRSLSSKSIH